MFSRSRMVLLYAYLCLVSAFFLINFQAVAQSAVVDPELVNSKVAQIVDEVYGQINSPFCKGRLLRDCPSSGASELKGDVRQLASEGKTSQEIVAILYKRYGEEIRAVPTDDLIGQLAWLGPLIFLAFGGALLAWWLARSSSKRSV